jgi:hypothetical protein
MIHRRIVPAAIGALALVAGCYATTPHRAEVTATGPRATCDGAVSDVMTRAGLIALMPPARYSMLFGPRAAGPAAIPKSATMGIGVVIREETGAPGQQTCSVTLEAISTDTSCAAIEPPECENPYLRTGPSASRPYPLALCGSNMTCDMNQAPGHEGAIDDFARQVRDTLGPSARVVALRAN